MGQVIVDEVMVRRMARDASIYSLTRPWAIVMWLALAAGLILSLSAPSAATRGGTDDGFRAWMPVIIAALSAYAVVLTVASARRAVRIAMPPGTTVWARVDGDALRIGSGTRTSEIRYDTFRSLSAGKDAVLLRLRGASVATAIPRAVLSDEDVATLRARIG